MSNGTVTPQVTPPEVEGEVEVEEKLRLLAANAAVDPADSAAKLAADELAAAIEDLRLRGVVNPEQFASLGVVTIAATCRWFDDQGSRVGPGVLVMELRNGGRRQYDGLRRSVLDSQREYGEQIEAWLTAKFPDLCKTDSRIIAAERKLGDLPLADRLAAAARPHIAARAAVIRLHARDGRGLTVKQHGPEIRAAAKAYDKRALAAYKRMTGDK